MRVPSSPINYPVIIVEDSRKNEFTRFNVVYRATGFSVLGRVPNAEKFDEGQLFDVGGRVFKYSGSSGWPRFSPRACNILDNFILPGLLSKIFEMVVYFGPTLVTEEKVDVEEFKHRLVAAIERHGSKDLGQLKSILSRKSTFSAVVESLEHWRYYGGRRDEHGHDHDLEDE